jgi:hypothetical protein
MNDTTTDATIEKATATVALCDLPHIGQPLLGGLFSGVTTKKDGTHCAVVLLPARPAEDLNWKAAMQWAKDVDAELPTRPVAALLFANLGDQFDREWHWTSEEYGGSYAWYQYFLGGFQSYGRQSYEGRARAVRLIPLVL